MLMANESWPSSNLVAFVPSNQQLRGYHFTAHARKVVTAQAPEVSSCSRAREAAGKPPCTKRAPEHPGSAGQELSRPETLATAGRAANQLARPLLFSPGQTCNGSTWPSCFSLPSDASRCQAFNRDCSKPRSVALWRRGGQS